MPFSFTRPTWLRLSKTALAIYWLALVTGTHWPKQLIPAGEPLVGGDKLLHFSAYAGLAVLITLVMRLRLPVSDHAARTAWRQMAFAVVIASVAGLLDELTQPLVGRDFDWFDWFADTSGAICGALAAMAIARYSGNRLAPSATLSSKPGLSEL